MTSSVRLNHLLAFEPQASLAPLLRARCFQQLDRIDEAISDCRAHLACSPADAEVNGLLALLLYEQSQREAATGHAAAALRRDPKQLDALLALASMQADEHEYDAAYRSKCLSLTQLR